MAARRIQKAAEEGVRAQRVDSNSGGWTAPVVVAAFVLEREQDRSGLIEEPGSRSRPVLYSFLGLPERRERPPWLKLRKREKERSVTVTELGFALKQKKKKKKVIFPVLVLLCPRK